MKAYLQTAFYGREDDAKEQRNGNRELSALQAGFDVTPRQAPVDRTGS